MEIRDENGLTEEEFLSEYKKKNYPRPYLTVDIVIFCLEKNEVLLIKRKNHPFINKYALPGGFAMADENLRQSAVRELYEETSVKMSDVIEIGEFSTPNRDPRGWVVTFAYLGIVHDEDIGVKANDDAKEAKWFKIVFEKDTIKLRNESEEIAIDDLAFDHRDILLKALDKLRLR